MSDTANEATQKKIELKQKENDINRSKVRQYVTYSAVWTYLGVSAVTVGWLMSAEKYDMAVAVLGGIGSMTAQSWVSGSGPGNGTQRQIAAPRQTTGRESKNEESPGRRNWGRPGAEPKGNERLRGLVDEEKAAVVIEDFCNKQKASTYP